LRGWKRELNLKKHIIKTIKIIILTGIWGIINILFLMPIENEYLSLKEIAVYLWTWHLGWINHLWYMGALVCIYVFFPLLKIAYDNNRKAFIYFVVVCAILTFGNKILNCVGTVISNLIGIHEGTISINWFNMFNPFGNIYGYTFVYFCVGGVAHEYVEKIRAITCKKNNILAIISVC
jgi:surface polysaccharide O-acyltransferase-like enzyme